MKSGPIKAYDIPAAVAITLSAQTSISLLAACVPILAPVIAKSRGWDVNVITFYPMILYLSAFAISFEVPRLLTQFGGMGLNVICIFLSAAALLCFAVPSLGLAAAAVVAFGIANGAMNPASSQVLGPRTTLQNAALIMSIKQTGVPLGATIAGVLIPFLVLKVGWQEAVFQIAAVGMVLAVLLVRTVKWLNGDQGGGKPRHYRPLDPLKRLIKMPGMLAFLLAGTTFAAMQLCLRSFFTVYLVNDLGLSLAAAGLALSVSQAAGIVGQLFWATLSDRVFSAHAVMAILGVVMGVAATLTATFSPAWPLVALLGVAAIYGFSAAGFIPVVLGEIARGAPPGEAGALTSSAQLFLIAGVVIGPFIFGSVASMTSYRIAFLMAAIWTVGGAVAAARAGRSGGLLA